MKKIILLCMLIGSSPLFAEAVATVLYANNKVLANRDGVERTLARGAPLEAGDAVITAAGALANIKYLNGTLVNIGENSNYKILSYSPDAKDVQIKAELNTGKVHFQTTGKVKESLKTPVIALAILGTDAHVYVASKTQTYVSVGSGQVQAGNNKPIGAGESILADPKGIVKAEYPTAGQVNTPKGTPGAISVENSKRQTVAPSQSARTQTSTSSAKTESTTKTTNTTKTTSTAKTESANKKQERSASSEKSTRARKEKTSEATKTKAQERRSSDTSTKTSRVNVSEAPVVAANSSSSMTAANAAADIGNIINSSQTAGNAATNAALAASANLAMITITC